MRTRVLRSCLVLGLLGALASGVRGGPGDAVGEFKKAFARAQDPAARQAALRELAATPTVDAAKVLARLVVDPALDPATRDVAQSTLEGFSAADVVLWAGEAVKPKGRDQEKEPRVRAALCGLLGARGASDVAAGLLLVPALGDDDWSVQVAAAHGLSRVRDRAAVDALVRQVGLSDGRVRGDVLRALRALTGEGLATPGEAEAWWTVNRARWTPPSPGAAPRAPDPDGARTVSRLEPAGDGSPLWGTVESSRVLFIVDDSYSMVVKVPSASGPNPSRLEYVKQSLAATIESQLDEHDKFNIIVFSDAPKPWKRALQPASRQNKREALAWIQAIQLEGDTNICDTLELAFRHPDVDTIYLLTDGTPTLGRTTIPDEILAEVRRWNAGRGVRVNTIAFLAGDGAAVQVTENKGMSESFLRALAEQTGGQFSMFD